MASTSPRRTSAPISDSVRSAGMASKEASLLLKAALLLLLVWLLGVVGAYDVGSLVHVPLLVGLMLLLLAFLKAHDAAASDQTDSGADRK